ncbi:unnamed protein product [Cunninghamella echinulata]
MELYPTGITNMIILTELEKKWENHCRKKIRSSIYTVEHLYDMTLPAVNILLEVQVDHLQLMHGSIWMATVKDESLKEMDAYLHPKYNQWIDNSISPLITDFIKERSFRFICPPRINTLTVPKNKNHGSAKLSRSDSIICVATTHELMWKLTEKDKGWIKELFTDRFSTVIRPESMVEHPQKKIHKLWLKVVHVEYEEIMEDGTHTLSQHTKARPTLMNQFFERNLDKRVRLDIYVTEQPFKETTEYALISFFDHQLPLAKSIQRGDFIGLYNPLIADQLTPSQASQSDLVFECGPETVLFLLPQAEYYLKKNLILSQPSQPSQVKDDEDEDEDESDIEFWQTNNNNNNNNNNGNNDNNDINNNKKKGKMKMKMKLKMNDQKNQQEQRQKNQEENTFLYRDDEGIIDCSYYTSKLRVRQLEASMINITLYGRVIAKANNNPYQKNLKWMDRYAIRIEDETGKLDITLWEQTGRYAKKIQIGQCILITGLTTTIQHKTDKGVTWFTNGSHICGTTIYNVSELDCSLVSTCFRSLTPLNDIQGEGNWHTEAMIVGWEIHTFDPMEPIKNASNNVDPHICISDYIITLAHNDCLLPINEDFKCNYCCKERQENATTYIYRPRQKLGTNISNQLGWIEWRLDNGFGILNVYGFEMLFLNCTAEQFKAISNETQIKLLNQVIGQRYLFSLSCINSRGYHIDKCIPFKPNMNEYFKLLNEILTPE